MIGNSVEVTLRVTWATMFQAKMANALRPSRIVLFAVALGALSVGLGALTGIRFWPLFVGLSVGLVGIRLGGMLLSSMLDRNARRFDGGRLMMSSGGLTVALSDGTVLERGWDWVIDARERSGCIQLRLNERRGRLWLRVTKQIASVRACLERAGKLK